MDWKLGGLIAALVLASGSARADAVTSDESVGYLADQCSEVKQMMSNGPRSRDSGFKAGSCIGFLSGANSVFAVYGAKAYCLPDEATFGQQALVLVAWAEKNPDKLHTPKLIGFMYAMNEAFPCTVN